MEETLNRSGVLPGRIGEVAVVEFRVLGPVEVLAGDKQLAIGHARQRAVLAVLLLELGRPLPTELLIDRVWGADPPSTVRNVLYGYIARLRAVLASAADPGIELRRQAGSYQLRADPEQLDLTRFRALVAEAAAAGSDEQAATVLSAATGLWRGPALAGLDSAWLAATRTTLELERRAAQLDLNDARLRLGHHDALASDLAGQAAAMPFDERLTGQLMLALYRAGRPAEALRHYDQVRHYLAGELGADPGAELRTLHRQILTADPSLALPVTVTARTVPVPRELPPDVAAFTGRTAELAALDQLLLPAASRPARPATTAVISALSGTAGVGKTALALHWAHREAAHFPDGQLYVNLRGYDPDQPVAAADALASFLRALGTPATDIPADESERSARYRSLLAGRRTLILLDNAATVEQVRPLLPGSPGCMVLITSRDSLAGLVARDGATRLDLDLLPLEDATALLRGLIGARADADPAAVTELAGQCARLPLALRVAAELAVSRPGAPLAGLVTELADQQRRLNLLDAGGDPRTAVRAVFSWSYDHLDAETARTFRLAGLHPGPDFEPYAVAALADCALDDARRALDVLAGAHLVQRSPAGRYSMHDLLRAYARELAAVHQKRLRHEALSRLHDHYLHAAASAMDTLFPGERDRRPRVPAPVTPAPPLTSESSAQAWLETERRNLVAVAVQAADSGWPHHATRIAATLFRYLDAGSYFAEARIVHDSARRAAQRTADQAGEAGALTALGALEWRQGAYEQAVGLLEEALRLFRLAGDDAGQARALQNLGNVRYAQGSYHLAVCLQRQALELFRKTGDRAGEAGTLNSLGNVEEALEHHEQAASHHQQCVDICREIGFEAGEAYALGNLGRIELHLDRLEQAADHHREALTLFRRAGHRTGEIRALNDLGLVSQRLGRDQDSADNLGRALAISRQTGSRNGEAEALLHLGRLDSSQARHQRAIERYKRALTLFREIGSRAGEAHAHAALGRVLRTTGVVDDARLELQRALALYTDLGLAEAEEVRTTLAELGDG